MSNQPKLIKKIELHYELELLTGLHIGAGKDNVEIGGIDNPVIRAKLKENQPYIPGSSLKGKLRSLLELSRGVKLGDDSEINMLFGSQTELTRLIVRDSYLSNADALKNADLDMPYTEAKYENSINRTTGTARDPRQTERVPAGAKFDVKLMINIYENDNEKKLQNLLFYAIELLNRDYLGGSGTRGYGHVKITLKDTQVFDVQSKLSEFSK